MPGTPSSYRVRLEAFRSELKRIGYVEGRDFSLELRWAENKPERFPALAKELAKLQPVAIVTASSAGVRACKEATASIPVVFASAGFPVEQGFVASLRRPGGNVTGVVTLNVDGKVAEIARELLPKARRLAILVFDPDPAHKGMVDAFVPAAKRLNFEAVVARVRQSEELAVAFNEIVKSNVDALYVPALFFVTSHKEYLIDRALKAKLPLLSSYDEITAAGGLLSYGYSRAENFRHAAMLVDKILQGAKAAELPVEQPTRFDFVVNMKTAREIGVVVSQSILLRATRVIE